MFKRYVIIITFIFMIVLMFFFTYKGTMDAFDKPDLGFSSNSNFIVTELDPQGPAIQAGFELNDRIIKINGSSVNEGKSILALGRSMDRGDKIIYTIQKENGRIQEYTLTFQPPSTKKKTAIIINSALSIIVVIIGFVTYYRNRQSTPAILFFLLCITFIFFRMEHPRWQQELWSRVYQVVYLLGFFMIPTMFAHLCGRFPRPNYFLYFKKNRIYWIYLPPSILIVPAALINWIHYADVRAMQAITKLILIQGFILWAVYLIAGNLMLIHSFLKVRSRILSRRCVAVFYSLALAISPYLMAGAFEIFGRNSPSFTIASQFLFLPFPLSLAWAIDYGDDKSEGLPWMIGKYLLKNN